MQINFGKTLNGLRKERGLTQEGLADFLGVSFQAVSKWERGESLPDISALPVIASFFNVTTDTLLGMDEAERETEVLSIIETYYREWKRGEEGGLYEIMKKAVHQYPGEFRLLVRYLNVLIAHKGNTAEGAQKILREAESIYERIQNYCTADSIRIWSKKLICGLYCRLSEVEGSGRTFEDVEEILEEMPLMQNGRDYLSVLFYPPGEKRDEAAKTAISQLLRMFSSTLSHRCYYDSRFGYEEKIHAANTALNAQRAVYPEEDYGVNFLEVIYSHAHLGEWYFLLNNEEEALKNMRKCAELARAFDGMPEETEHTSPLVTGLKFNKERIINRNQTMCARITELFTEKYAFSQPFKDSAAFSEILEILK